ncbi:MAG: YceI family protein [Chloroflexota bacterium]
MKTEALTKTKWIVDKAHSEFGFKVKHLMITWVKGVFRDVEATVYTDGDDFMTSQIEVRIEVASIYTGDEKRDAHLRSPDFFDTDNHKQAVFMSKKLEKTRDEDKYILYGTLSIKGVEVPVKLDVEYEGSMKDPWGVEKAGFVVTGEISRKDWELTWNASLETGGVLVGDAVKINCEIQMMKANTDSVA